MAVDSIFEQLGELSFTAKEQGVVFTPSVNWESPLEDLTSSLAGKVITTKNINGWCFDYVQYGDWLRVAPKKPQEGSSLPRGRIRYHDVGSLSNVPSNDLGKGAAKANLNHEATVVKLGTPLDANLGENMTDDNMVEDLLDTDSIGTEQGPTLFDAYIATSPIATRKDEATIVASLVAAGTVVFAVSTLEVLSAKTKLRHLLDIKEPY
ncbi:hypothetical protein V6N13_025009 [Hibiscus sabdariffa]